MMNWPAAAVIVTSLPAPSYSSCQVVPSGLT